MQGNHITFCWHVPGTLAANETPVFAFPFDVTLIMVQAVGSNTNNAQIKCGYVGSDAAYLALSDVGDANTPLAYDRDNFVGGECPHIAKDTPIVVYVDYDGSAGTAVQNLTVLLLFSEG